MSRTPIATSQSPQPNAPIAQAVRTGNLIFVSGITPFTLDLRLAKDDFPAQMRQTMENVGAPGRVGRVDVAGRRAGRLVQGPRRQSPVPDAGLSTEVTT